MTNSHLRVTPTAESAKAELLSRAAASAVRGRGSLHGEGEDVLALIQQYYRYVLPDDLLGRDPADVAGAALSHRQLAAERPEGRSALRAFNPTVEEQGWSSPHTIVEVVTDDMPFLVDSVTGLLAQDGRSVHLVIHPQVLVDRDVTGRMQGLVDEESATPTTRRESWMHIEIDREGSVEALDGLAQRLRAVLRDVRESVEDWPKMIAAARRAADDLTAAPPAGVPDAEVAEAWELLNWLAEGHFTFVGYREYALSGTETEIELNAVPGSGLGVLRDDPIGTSAFARLPVRIRQMAYEPNLLILTKANRRSTVHRPTYLDYVGVKQFDSNGRVVGERRFLGLYTSSAYTESVRHIPVVRRKAMELLQRSGFPPGGHSARELEQVVETHPRDEMFQASVDELLPIMLQVQNSRQRRTTRLYVREDVYGRFVSALVYLPRDRYTTPVRLAIGRLLMEAYRGTELDYTTRVGESVSARLHFVVRVDQSVGIPEVDTDELQRLMVEETRTWGDHFLAALVEEFGEEHAGPLSARYGDAFPEAYKEDFPARVGAVDIRHLEELPAVGMAVNMYEPLGASAQERRFKVYRTGPPLSVSDVLPVLQRLGVEVVDERPYEIERTDGDAAYVYDFGLNLTAGGTPDAQTNVSFEEAFSAIWAGNADSDGLNALVLAAGLSWRQVTVVRAYARYMRQVQALFSPDYIEEVMVTHPGIVSAAIRLFEARFDPDFAGDRSSALAAANAEVEAALDAVLSLDIDRILRGLLNGINATLRTNYYVRDEEGQPRPFLSVKFDPRALPNIPEPRPAIEIWVHSPRVEGVHLRFGAVARGGLRWSDRKEDFRTEVLGLVKAQEVKNAVIVPVGAKGGFVPRRLPDPEDREAFRAEGVAAYQCFISAMLDVTDNYVDGLVVTPERVVRHDGDDPYLVVAADKGTATFSDIANELAMSYGFWLGDAFASGGSDGYDHKAMGITARGAWESVKRHFREVGVDVQSESIDAVGIGDMSGDVFGNGMLLSEHIRLVAAFDHRHVFVDPNPDPAVSYAERRRLFDLPRSSWADYNPELISPGGGVWERTVKKVPLSNEARLALGLESDGPVTPDDVVRAILRAPVDLLFNGGVGTFVKATTESAADVGDKTNDSVRINGRELRCMVVGEGGNLGMTQAGRIEAAQHGVRLNTDAIDNSAGVDTSDHEVNLKILLDRVVAAGDLTVKQRNAVLVEVTDQVASLVLRNNYEQNVLLGNARSQAAALLPVHQRLIQALESRGRLDRALEGLPDDEEIARRLVAAEGLTSPEFCVLVAYSKNDLTRHFTESTLPEDPWFSRRLREYFPDPVADRFGEWIETHPLRREIIATTLAGDLVDRGGITFAFRAVEESGSDYESVARAFTVAREVFGLPQMYAEVESLDNRIPTQAQVAMLLEMRRLLDRSVRWLMGQSGGLADITGLIERYAPTVQALIPSIPDLLQGGERDRMERRANELAETGLPEDLAVRTSVLLDVFGLLDIADIAAELGEEAASVAALYFVVSERMSVDALLLRITALPRNDRWQAMARMSLRDDLYAAHKALTRGVAAETQATDPPEERLGKWEEQHVDSVGRLVDMLQEISTTTEGEGLAPLSVGLRVLRSAVE